MGIYSGYGSKPKYIMQIGSHWRLVLLLKISYLYWCSRPICNGLNLSTFSFPIARDLALRSLDKFITYSLLLDRESIPRELPKWGSRSSSNSNNIMRGCLYAITVVYCCRRSRKVSQGNINRDRGTVNVLNRKWPITLGFSWVNCLETAYEEQILQMTK